MKTLLIIICCLLLINWGLDSRIFHITTVHWDYSFGHYMSEAVGLGTILCVGILIAVGFMLGTAAVVVTALFLAFAAVICALISALWPFLLIGLLIVLCSSTKSRRSY